LELFELKLAFAIAIDYTVMTGFLNVLIDGLGCDCPKLRG